MKSFLSTMLLLLMVSVAFAGSPTFAADDSEKVVLTELGIDAPEYAVIAGSTSVAVALTAQSIDVPVLNLQTANHQFTPQTLSEDYLDPDRKQFTAQNYRLTHTLKKVVPAPSQRRASVYLESTTIRLCKSRGNEPNTAPPNYAVV